MKINRYKLEIAMARAKIDRTELAEKAGVPFSTICTVYRRKSCKPITAGRIADALGVDVTTILEDN